MNHTDAVEVVAFSPDGKYVVSGSNDRTARVWEAATGEEIARMTHDESVRTVAFSPDGKYVVSGSRDNTARVWEVSTGREFARTTHNKDVNIATFSPDGRYVASGSADTVRVWIWQMDDLISDACARLTRNLTLAEWRQYLGNDEAYEAICPTLPIESEISITPTASP
jgi:WD40 repeat protein